MTWALLASSLRKFENIESETHHSGWSHHRPHRSFALLLSLFSVEHICPILDAVGTHFIMEHVVIIRNSQFYIEVLQQSSLGLCFVFYEPS